MQFLFNRALFLLVIAIEYTQYNSRIHGYLSTLVAIFCIIYYQSKRKVFRDWRHIRLYDALLFVLACYTTVYRLSTRNIGDLGSITDNNVAIFSVVDKQFLSLFTMYLVDFDNYFYLFIFIVNKYFSHEGIDITMYDKIPIIGNVIQAGTLFGRELISKTYMVHLINIFLMYNLVSLVQTYILGMSFAELYKYVTMKLFTYSLYIPLVKNALNSEKQKIMDSFEKDLKSKSRNISNSNIELPKHGLAADRILSLMSDCAKVENGIWQDGKVSGAIYHGVKEHQDLLNKAFGMYSIANPLHPDIWPSGMKFESEIISMTKSLVSGTCDTVCGSTTSGGTESIILAIKAHRDYYFNQYGITDPELICSTSAHAAVDKACDLMKIKLIKIPMDPVTYTLDVNSVAHYINRNTILIYSSAPSYPQGVIDPISSLSELALKYGVGLHVDCCLGGFFLPFARKLNHPSIPVFDFSLPGVTSMSVDTHKYGYALKGTSVVLYRTTELRQAQYFCYADWTGGLYTTPTVAGSRSGGLIAQCWASLVALGEEGYLKHTKDIIATTKIISDGVRSMPDLYLLGNADAMIVCFDSKTLNIYDVLDAMSRKGWSLNSHQNPRCIHICVTVTHVGHAQKLLQDLNDCVLSIKNNSKNGNAKSNSSAAIYGMTTALPAGPINEILKIYNDVVLNN